MSNSETACACPFRTEWIMNDYVAHAESFDATTYTDSIQVGRHQGSSGRTDEGGVGWSGMAWNGMGEEANKRANETKRATD
mgnify:FL=1